MRVAESLKLGTVRASELTGTLLRSDRPSGLAKAIKEVGRIHRPLYLLNYIDRSDYRRRILTQLNRGRADIMLLGRSATRNGGKSENGIGMARKTSWVHWDWSRTP